MNPIELGKSIEAKDFILDSRVLLNNHTVINLEMQVLNRAKLFKAKTWEEIKMLAGNNTFLEEAAETAYRLSAEEKIRMQCEAREDYYRQQRYIQKQLDKLKELESREQDMIENNASLKVENEKLLKSNEEKDAEIARLKLELSKKQ